MHSFPPRESSPSPFRERPRTIKATSMPLVPSVSQVLASQQTSQTLQSSPTSSSTSRRSPPYQSAGAVQRLLPTPPHPNPPNLLEPAPERRMSPPPSQHPTNASPHYPRPIARIPPPQFLTKFDMEEPWQMTEELLADIERADKQQSQGQTQTAPNSPHTFQNNFAKSDSPAKDPLVERVRSRDRSSPKANEGSPLGRRQSLREQSIRESPKARDRLPASPKRASFSPVQSQTPERQVSPSFNNGGLPSPGEAHRHESPPVLRRVNGLVNDNRSSLSLATQTPPLQAINTRTPDRSLPFQENEDEHDNNSKDHNGVHDDDSYAHKDLQGLRDHHESPLPSSDLDPDPGRYDLSHTHGGRNSRAGHRKDHISYEDSGKRSTDDGGFTPRSNSVALPDHVPVESRQVNVNGSVGGVNQAANANTVRANDSRRRSRNGFSDQMGLSNIDTAFLQQAERDDQSSQYVDHKTAAQQAEAFALYAQHFYPDDIQSFMEHPTSSYIQAYLRSPRPDAPIPPTPHSQTSPPSPSPLLSGAGYAGTKELPPFTPVTPVGSPYPYPFTHVMRSHAQPTHQTQNNNLLNLDLNNPSAIHEQFVKQWQIYAQNNHGNVTDSTLSPSSTPYPTPPFNPWAHWHTQRILGGGRYGFPPGTATQRSSPSHEPVDLPAPPALGLKKKTPLVNLRSYKPMQPSTTIRKPPPRVDSTQPRETSPEPSSSGEETAGEDRYTVAEEGSWVNSHSRTPSGNSTDNVVTEADDEDDGEWVEEDWDDDEDDLLDLEYHPSFVNNIEKRRRRFETRWDALMHAFQALDRQTDATMVLLAAPSHSPKLHMATSRSIRRQTNVSRSSAMTTLRSGFRQIATERRSMRSRSKTSLADRFLMSSGASGDGSDSSESREADLKRALDAALSSLGVLGNMYEQREARWLEEMRRISEDRERVELLLRQALGVPRS